MTPLATPLSLVILEDDAADAELLVRELRRSGFAPDWTRVQTEGDFLAALRPGVELVLADYTLPQYNGLAALQELRRSGLDIPLIFVSGTISDDRLVELMKEGASDYLQKDRLARLGPAVAAALDHHELQRQKRLAEERFRATFEQAAVGMAHVGLDGRWLRVNQKMCEIGGYSREELIGHRFNDFVPPGEIESVGGTLRQLVTGEISSYTEDWRAHRKDGSFIWVATTSSLVRTATGEPDYFITVVEDISARKQAAAALRESEERFRATFEQAAVGIAQLAPDGRLVRVNQKMCDVGGYSREELMTLSLADLSHPAELQLHLDSMELLLAGEGTSYAAEARYLRKDGSFVWINLTGSLVRTATGEPDYFIAVLEDISARKHAEAALRESEERFKGTFESAMVGIYRTTPDGQILMANPALVAMLGYSTLEELRQHRVQYSGFQSDGPRTTFQQLIERDGFVRGFEASWLRQDGSVVLVRESSRAGYDAEGNCAFYEGTVEDVTDRKRAEDALRENEARFRTVLETLPVAVRVFDGERIVFTNRASNAMTGYSTDEILAPGFRELLNHPNDLPAMADRGERRFRGEPVEQEYETRIVRKDGEVHWVHSNNVLITFDGRPAILVASTDISARKQAEDALRLQSAALNAAVSAIVITGVDGAIQWVNPAFTALSGYSAGEAIGQNPRALLKSGLQGEPFYRDLWDTILAGKVWQGELVNRRKDGSLYSEEQSITPVKNTAGNITNFVAIKRDVTERKQLQAQLLQSQKMEGVGRLAGGIAHDFNNLLNVINGTASIVSEELRAGDPLQKDVQEIIRAADQAAAMTRQLLAFSRKEIVQPKIMDLGALIKGMEGMLRRLIGEDVDLVVAPPEGSCVVRADPGQLEQVVMNLALNARDAMPIGGTLTIEVGATQVDGIVAGPSLEPGAYVRLRVSDTGSGMDEATLARIFEPFFTTKEVGKGTGLGLSTVYGIVQQSGGSILVDSQVGKGTRFTLWFPPAEEPEPVVEAAAPVSKRGTETILLVEDYSGLRALAASMLRRAGFTVLVAGSGQEALDLLARHDGPVDLLLTDVVMPAMGGGELVEKVAEARPGMKVIYASGYTDDDLVRRGIQADLAHLIRKPYTQEALTSAVRNALDAG